MIRADQTPYEVKRAMRAAVQLILRANKLMNIEQLELVRDMVAATRANALEEAAKVCERRGHAEAEHCAAAIRALVKQSTTEEERA